MRDVLDWLMALGQFTLSIILVFVATVVIIMLAVGAVVGAIFMLLTIGKCIFGICA